MYTLTLKIPEIIKEKLNSYSEYKGLSKSEIVRNALLEYFDKGNFEKEGTFYDMAKDLAGSVESTADLSTNKKFLTEYGK